MKILIYTPYTLDNNSTPVLLDEAFEFLRDPANHVVVVTCQGAIRPCLTNSEQSPVRCMECRFSTNLLMRMHRHERLTHETLASFLDARREQDIDRHQFQYDTLDDVKRIEWNGVNIGLSVVSTYVSLTRNLHPALNARTRQFIDDSLRAEARLLVCASRMFEKHRPDLVCIFNGRFVGLRPVLELAQQAGIRTKVLENTFSTSVEEVSKVEFYDSLPHDIDRVTPIIERTWDTWSKDSDKHGLASTFYERRRSGAPASDAVYVANQRPELLPEGWDATKRNFVIFNSSEDEFFAIGAAFDKYKLFDDQLQGIRYLARQTLHDPSIQYHLRIHPNLARISFAYHTQLASLAEEFSNVSVIPAASPISTYALIDHCEKVFVFGSTAGVEATFWGKPVILMAGAMYLHLDVAYYPSDLNELNRLIVDALPPKPRIGALKYGLFIFGQRGSPYKHVNFNYRLLKIGSKSLPIARCYEYRGSILPYASVALGFRLLNGLSHTIFKTLTMRQLSVEAHAEPVAPAALTDPRQA